MHNTEAGIQALTSRNYQYLGLLDADLDFQADYFETLIQRFEANSRLGLAGGVVIDVGRPRDRFPRNRIDVPGAVQLFRRDCFERLGGLVAIPEGGWDGLTCAMARMNGFETQLFTDLVVDHLKPRNVSQGGPLRRLWQLGVRDYAIGYDPLFEVFKCLGRTAEPPFLASALTRCLGFFAATVGGRPRVVPRHVVEFVRHEQRDRLRALWRGKRSPTPGSSHGHLVRPIEATEDRFNRHGRTAMIGQSRHLYRLIDRRRAAALLRALRARVQFAHPPFMSTVDVVIPCYNYARYLRACVDSVLSQEGVHTRVLIIDDASSDETAQVGSELAAADTRVEFRRHETNKGHIATYNEGLIGWSTGDYAVLLSADDMLAPDSLKRATRHHGCRRPRSAWSTAGRSSSRTSPNSRKPAHVSEADTLWSGAEWLAGRCRAGHNVISSPEVVVRGAIQRAVGGYRPDLPHLADFEMWLRIAAVSNIAYVRGAPQAFYRRHSATMTTERTRLIDLDGAARRLSTCSSSSTAISLPTAIGCMTWPGAPSRAKRCGSPAEHTTTTDWRNRRPTNLLLSP